MAGMTLIHRSREYYSQPRRTAAALLQSQLEMRSRELR